MALAVTIAAPGAGHAAAQKGSVSKATSSSVAAPAAARPRANVIRTVDGRQVAVPLTAPSTVIGTPRPTPSGPVLYVKNLKGANCSDTASGAGTQAVPFCTLQAAANAVVAGDTVLVYPGTYLGFTLTAQGTADAPITFESSVIASNPGQDENINLSRGLSSGTVPAHWIDVEDSNYVDLENFDIRDSATSDGALINASHHVTLNELMDWVDSQTTPDIYVTGASSYVTITRASEFNAVGQPYIQVDAGGSNDVIADNAFWGDYGTTVAVDGTPNTEITGNSFMVSYSTAISLTGASPNSTVEDNLLSFNFTGTNTPSIVIGAGSTSGTTLDYNVVEPAFGAAYQWDASTYANSAALTTATGQGAHEIYDRPHVYVGGNILMLDYDSVGIDSANAAAPGEQATDIFGQSCVDDPSYPVTGAGTPAYCSRGSFQYQDPLSGLVSATPMGSMSAKADATPSHGLNPITSYSFNFGDGTAPVVNSTGIATHTYTHSGYYLIAVTVTDSTGAINTSATPAQVRTSATDFSAMTPTRVLDTRKGIGGSGKMPANSYVEFPVPAAAASHGGFLTAVALNVTVTNATGNGYISVARGTSNLNYTAGQTIAAMMIAPVFNDNGVLSVTLAGTGSNSASVDVIADMTGVFAIDGTDGYQPMTPARLLDTRKGIGGYSSKLTPGAPDVVTIAGAGGGALPASGVTAVAVNLTVANTSAGGGYVTAYPDGGASPGTSTINFATGQTLANFAIVPVGADGKIDLASSVPTDAIVDVVGYFSAAGGSGFVVADPYRDIDTRAGRAACNTATGALAKYGVLTTNIVCPTAAFPLTTDLGNVTAVAVNQTVTMGGASGYLTTYPAGAARPASSDLDWQQPNQTVANATFAGTGSAGETSFYNGSSGQVQLIVDVFGYFSNS